MTISPELEVQKLILTILQASVEVMSLVDGVHDTVPSKPFGTRKAYVSLGATDTVDDGADCIDGIIHTVQVDVWSRSVGMPDCKKICTAVKRALLRASALTENALCDVRLTLQQTLRDPDGLTNHGVLQFEFQIEDRANG